MTERIRPSESSCGDSTIVMGIMPPAGSPMRSSRSHPREREHKYHPQRWTRPAVSGEAACARQRCANMLTEATGICGISNANNIKDRNSGRRHGRCSQPDHAARQQPERTPGDSGLLEGQEQAGNRILQGILAAGRCDFGKGQRCLRVQGLAHKRTMRRPELPGLGWE